MRWQPVGERSAVIGHVLAEQVTAGVGAFSPQIAPHPSDPFVVADTTTSAMRLVRARLEGAVSWRSGAWTAGLAPGLEVADHRTQESTLPRIVRAASPGITAGIGRVFAGGGVAVAAHARWAATSETIRFIAWPALGVVYRLQGYGDPTPVQIGGSPSSLEFTRYSEHRALAGGLAASARLLGADWVVFGERTRRRDQHRNERRPDAPTDRWNADGWHLGLAAAGAVLDGRLRITASADYIALDGDALRADIADVIFDSRERALRTVIDVRFTPTAAPWMIAARVGFDHAQRDRWDYLVETGSEIGAWTSAFALEIARRLGQGTFLSASSGISFYEPRALLPSTAAVGPAYERFIAPELALYGMAARPFTTTATLRHAVSEAVAVTLGGRADWLTPSGESTLPAAAAPNDGQRTRWHAAFGVAVTR